MSSAHSSFLFPREQVFDWNALALGNHHRDQAFPFGACKRYLFLWARNAIFHGLTALEISPGDRVLVPAYLCAAAVEPILAHGAQVDFYNVRRDCRVDLPDLESRVGPKTRALLVVHYFGFPQDIQQIKQLCSRFGLALVEDCAHVLNGEFEGRPLGSFGDIGIFSWHKFLSVYDGGELVINRAGRDLRVNWTPESSLFTLKVAKNLLDSSVSASGKSLSKIPGAFIQRVDSALRRLLSSSCQPQVRAPNLNDPAFDPHLANWPMSRLSRWILDHSNVSEIVEKRRRNYEFLQERLTRIAGIRPLHSRLPVGVCPLVFPVFFEAFPNAHLSLRQLGIPATTWGFVRYSGIESGVFPDADFLFDDLVFLPLHQSLEENHLKMIVGAVETAIHCRTGTFQSREVRLEAL